MPIKIKSWYGRLGNNITQLVNAIYLGLYLKEDFIYYPHHNLFKNKPIKISDTSYKQQVYEHRFFNRDKVCSSFNIDNTLFDKYKEDIKKLLKEAIEFKNINNNITENDLVIHIRSGDVYNKTPHPGWIQPPLHFYEKVINSKKWEKIYLICEDTNSPVISPLLNKYNNIHFKIQPLIEDIKYIIGCKNICFGMGSFIPALLLFNNKIHNMYYPRYCYRYLLDITSYINKIEYNLPNYIKKGEWKNTKEQILVMLKYRF